MKATLENAALTEKGTEYLCRLETVDADNENECVHCRENSMQLIPHLTEGIIQWARSLGRSQIS